MKHLLVILLLGGLATGLYSQSTFKKRYFLKSEYTYDGETVHLKKSGTQKFSELPDSVKDKVRAQYPIGSELDITVNQNISF